MKLSKDSNTLLKFMSTKSGSFPSHVNLNKKTIDILKILFDDISNAHRFLLECKKIGLIYNCSWDVIYSSKQIPQPKNFNYNSFPREIRNHITEYAHGVIRYSFSLFDRKITILFVVEDGVEGKIGAYNKYIDKIVMLLYIINEYSAKHCSKTLTIYLYLTSHKKGLPRSNMETLDEIHINSAFTTACPADSEIVVFRKEEWFKVLTHEAFHSFGLDFSEGSADRCKKEILEIFPVKSDVNLYESYTECWAEILNIAFISFLFDNNHTFEVFVNSFNLLIANEMNYSFFQLSKILTFMGLKYSDLYGDRDHHKINRDTLYKENTNVLSYYVIKTILLNNFQGFLSWCATNNLSLLQFKKTPTNELEFCKFIKRNFKSKTMLENMKCADKLVKDKRNAYVNNNLRMSLCEMG
uniref:Uncharacterized protein n=1 Tax=viral metagenome TaxID=1070528 RepID=A0A6C0LM36_9ZZZZ